MARGQAKSHIENKRRELLIPKDQSEMLGVRILGVRANNL